MRQLTVEIAAGELNFTLERECLDIEELLGFASRENQKRGYLFVSKVLGKHIPCRPSDMRRIYTLLSSQLNVADTGLVVGMAETAVGLGGGVAHSLQQENPNSTVFYTHTTRYTIDQAEAFRIDESHSHAPDHILYEPSLTVNKQLKNLQHIILVDDEISTGRTLYQLSKKMRAVYPDVKRITWASIINWLPTDLREDYNQKLGGRVEFVSLVDGRFDFKPNEQFKAQLPENTSQTITHKGVRADTGRRSLEVDTLATAAKFKTTETASVENKPLAVIGHGEFLLQPFLYAESLEQQGKDVLFQSTTRSPILIGDTIKSRTEFSPDTSSSCSNQYYIYNLEKDRNLIYCYEQQNDMDTCGLRQLHPGIGAVLMREHETP